MQLWRSYPSYDPGRRFSTWMYRVALNTAISFARGARVRQRHVILLDDPGADGTAATPPTHESDERIAWLYRFYTASPNSIGRWSFSISKSAVTA